MHRPSNCRRARASRGCPRNAGDVAPITNTWRSQADQALWPRTTNVAVESVAVGWAIYLHWVGESPTARGDIPFEYSH